MEILGKDNYDVAFTVGGTVVSLDGHNHDHDALTNFVANEHINHSTLSVIAGTGLSGGGTLTTNRTVNLDINGLTADATPNGAADYVATYDNSATAHKKVLLDNMPGGGGGGMTYTEHFTVIPDAIFANTWTTKTLSTVTANSIVFIMVYNDTSTITKYGGIREVGSIKNRIMKIDKGQGLRFAVKTNASKQIQIYQEQTGSIDIYLIGEWN